MAKKLNGNQCSKCEKTHEECARVNKCPKADISRHVCVVFGTWPPRPLPRRRK